MKWFGDNRPLKVELPPLTPVDRVTETRAEMKLAASVLSALDSEIREFRKKHSIQTDRLDQIVRCRADSPGGMAAIRNEWFEIQRRKGRALHAFSARLKTWSAAVLAAKEQNR
jgi:hypothetical protein